MCKPKYFMEHKLSHQTKEITKKKKITQTKETKKEITNMLLKEFKRISYSSSREIFTKFNKNGTESIFFLIYSLTKQCTLKPRDYNPHLETNRDSSIERICRQPLRKTVWQKLNHTITSVFYMDIMLNTSHKNDHIFFYFSWE